MKKLRKSLLRFGSIADVAEPGPHRRRSGGRELSPIAVQHYLENIECDVLFLYDCCRSIHNMAGIATSGIKEALAAGGFETNAAEVGPHSFTHLLIQGLAHAASERRPISVSDLHEQMLSRFHEYELGEFHPGHR